MRRSIPYFPRRFEYPCLRCFRVSSHYPVACNEETYKGKCMVCRNNQCHFSQVCVIDSDERVVLSRRKQHEWTSVLGHGVAGRQH